MDGWMMTNGWVDGWCWMDDDWMDGWMMIGGMDGCHMDDDWLDGWMVKN